MKTLLLFFTLSSLLIVSASFAQTSKREYKIAITESPIDPESKAVKSFKRSHPDVSNESWSTEKGYYFVKFKEADVKNKIVYTPNGKIDYALKMYNGESKLPRSVRTAIRSTYYDYRILDAQELKIKNNTIYLVKITDTYTWKTIRVSNGDLEEIENYSTVISPCR
jgi:hypothetical protein